MPPGVENVVKEVFVKVGRGLTGLALISLMGEHKKHKACVDRACLEKLAKLLKFAVCCFAPEKDRF